MKARYGPENARRANCAYRSCAICPSCHSAAGWSLAIADIQKYSSRHSAPTQGAYASSRTWGGMRWTRRCWRRAAPKRTAKSCGPGAPRSGAKLSSDSKGRARATVANGMVHRGEHGVSRNPSRREGRSVSVCTCGHRARANSFCAAAPGAAATRSSLHPLVPQRVTTKQISDANTPRER